MSLTILLYGATGYSGRLIAAEAARIAASDNPGAPFRMLLAGRSGREVAAVARRYDMDHRVFALDDPPRVLAGLDEVDVVVNAAGPFALTASHLARAALAAGCHYVDINGEADVYMRTDDLSHHAIERSLAMVAAAGHSAAASDLLLDVALQQLRPVSPDVNVGEIGAVRLAFSHFMSLSRGSLETMWRSLREQVRVVRRSKYLDAEGNPRSQHALWHEPVGQLERRFDFFDRHAPRADRHAATARNVRIASAANVVDTLTARLTLERGRFEAQRLECYVEVGEVGRITFQLAPLLTPFAATPWSRNIVRLQLNALPEGPTPQERDSEPHLLVLEIDDRFQRPLIHWAWHTPNPYDFTARVALEIARRVARSNQYGWLTPAEVLQPTLDQLLGPTGYLRSCHLTQRHTAALEMV